jgi:hypothetical protein
MSSKIKQVANEENENAVGKKCGKYMLMRKGCGG